MMEGCFATVSLDVRAHSRSDAASQGAPDMTELFTNLLKITVVIFMVVKLQILRSIIPKRRELMVP